MYHKNVLEIVDLSLKDLLSSRIQTAESESRPDQLAYTTEHGVRYKLIIDGSEDDSAVRYLFACGVLNKGKTHMFSCSEFVDESHIHVSYLFSMFCYSLFYIRLTLLLVLFTQLNKVILSSCSRQMKFMKVFMNYSINVLEF